MQLSRPDNPVTLPTFDDVEPIADGLPIESGTLKVFNYQEYISPDVLAAFEDEFGVTVEVTTFISMDEASPSCRRVTPSSTCTSRRPT